MDSKWRGIVPEQGFEPKSALGFPPRFLTTGVGSVPFARTEEALRLIRQSVPRAPHWPQLPKMGAESAFIGQYLRALIESGVMADYARPRFQAEAGDWAERMARFYELYLAAEAGDNAALEHFGFSGQGGEGFEGFCRDIEEHGTREALLLKGQLSGPVTLGLQITDENRRASYYDDSQREMLVRSIAMHARWQTKRLKAYGLPVLMSVDDPGLYAVGASTHVTLEKGRIIDDLNSIAGEIMGQGGIPGAHVCAGMDWTILFDSMIEVVNFDAYEYMTGMLVLAEELERFLTRGGVLAWGIIPTGDALRKESVGSLRRRLEENIGELGRRGVNEERLRAQSMLTPSCGTGTLSPEEAERIYGLLKELEKELA
ncbi:Hypothetical protein DEACI_3736 [Acididesulfobacillus acetoxydans]|uniref:Methionine synthase vitamin-B12 independent n=1 Tax=Acididesulfobacillus acetoxydans TaxID=1561005 RepID=A0A8S0VYC9_9FIRM|nr:methionine synthase [Acididesulfobacillus acetoxydans]CAA7602913.1 Hypothetical protein DEACI_3736 [Acididesulfobacillus acetoxydans]CEJ05795.1 Methionine synthase vitamin-B12 independent [Acididesulfobacillus acetoxydans]